MERYEIRGLAREHFLDEWERDGWQVDRARGEVCVDNSWFPIEALPKILLNHMRDVREAQRDAKRQALIDEELASVGNTWQSRAPRLAAELVEVKSRPPMANGGIVRNRECCNTSPLAHHAVTCARRRVVGEFGNPECPTCVRLGLTDAPTDPAFDSTAPSQEEA